MGESDGKHDQRAQTDKFRDLARELKADEDPARFEETVRKIAPKPQYGQDQKATDSTDK
jgi:hypothetical protein